MIMDLQLQLFIVSVALSAAIVNVLLMFRDIRKRIDDLEDKL